METSHPSRRPVCTKCGTDVDPGTLLRHDLAFHPKAPVARAKPYVCRQPKCCEVYGPKGHMVGREGPHAY